MYPFATRTGQDQSRTRTDERYVPKLACFFVIKTISNHSLVIAFLIALNHELRDAGKLHATQMQKMTKALELASQNAAKARNEADEAEARTLTLESQLEALQVVVQETKLASQLLLSEQEEVTQKAQSVEQKYVEAQAELARSNAQKQKLQQSNEELMHSKQNLELQLQELLTKLENEEMETKRWKMSYQDLEGIEKTQQESIRRLEDDVEQANTLLVEATSTAAETESTSLDLKNNLEKMQQTVEGLHKKLENKQKDEQRDKERHQEVMETVQKETQVLKAQITSQKDQIKQLSFEKTTQEKRLSQLQAKSSNLERRLQESTNIVNTTTGGDFSIPPLNGNGKENPLPLPTHKCAICFKALTTLAKKCQCGKAGCTVRAHVSCVNKIRPGPSVSHPGTPAPQLPIVLCASRKARSTAITPGEKVK